MTNLSRKEALAAVNKARDRAQKAAEARDEAQNGGAAALDLDVSKAHYDRCVRELEEAINEASEWLATEEND